MTLKVVSVPFSGLFLRPKELPVTVMMPGNVSWREG